MNLDAVLFDLDGTLVDTAPDLVSVLNLMRREDGCAPLPFALARNEVSNGALGLLRRAYGAGLDESTIASLRTRFLEIYEKNLCINSKLFIEIDSIFNLSSELWLPWGIVTNKPQFLTEPLLASLGISERAACIVSGDQLPQRKPHPAPLQHAASLLGVSSSRCVYVGDAVRDILAGKAAGMRTIAAAYGYIRPMERVQSWEADAIVRRPLDLHSALLAMCGEA